MISHAGLTPNSSPLHVQNQSENVTPWSCPWLHPATPPCSWPSDRSEAPEYGPKCFSITETMGLDTKIKTRTQSYNFTPWSCPWPPTAPPPCSWPSDQSEALVNGPKWFSIPKNHGLDTKLVSSMNWSKVTIYAILAQNTHFRPTFAIFQGIGTWGLTTSYVKNFEFLLISTYQSTF